MHVKNVIYLSLIILFTIIITIIELDIIITNFFINSKIN